MGDRRQPCVAFLLSTWRLWEPLGRLLQLRSWTRIMAASMPSGASLERGAEPLRLRRSVYPSEPGSGPVPYLPAWVSSLQSCRLAWAFALPSSSAPGGVFASLFSSSSSFSTLCLLVVISLQDTRVDPL